MKNKYHIQQGFTLIELLVVITIILILSTVILANLTGVRDRGVDSANKQKLDQIQTALRLYYNDNNRFPTITSNCNSIILNLAQNGYMQQISIEPADICFYTYTSPGGGLGQGYQMNVLLRNEQDSAVIESQNRCRPGQATLPSRYYVCVL